MSKKAGKGTSISDSCLNVKFVLFIKITCYVIKLKLKLISTSSLNIDRTTISKIINKKDKWLHVEGGSNTNTVFKHRRVKFPLLQEAISCSKTDF